MVSTFLPGYDICDLCSFPSEVSSPTVQTGIEQTYDSSRCRIHISDVRSLVSIAVKTREDQILEVRLAAVLPGNDMIDLEWRSIDRVRYLAVFTTATGAPPDFLLDRPIHANGSGMP